MKDQDNRDRRYGKPARRDRFCVRQATIHETMCRRGWTASVRPPTSEADAIEHELMAQLPQGVRGEVPEMVSTRYAIASSFLYFITLTDDKAHRSFRRRRATP
jgi:hypothetical protein